MFELDDLLSKDSLFVRDLPLCQVRLMNNALYPWLVLIPRRVDMVEITDLSQADRVTLLDEMAYVSQALQKHTGAYKMNVAALGNQVRQLHVHIIARHTSDAAWPRPVWGGPAELYSDEKAQDMLETLRNAV
ncbi:MAG: HIT family protein [Rickettsiales bacterium]|nr:HIT family protein [Rickettsiales bacterium]